MQLDRVTTIAIGDLDADGVRIADDTFRRSADRIAAAVERHGGTVYAVTFGDGIGSDAGNEGAAERSAVILCGNVVHPEWLRYDVASVLLDMGGSSACFATDAAHEPVFNTIDGRRP